MYYMPFARSVLRRTNALRIGSVGQRGLAAAAQFYSFHLSQVMRCSPLHHPSFLPLAFVIDTVIVQQVQAVHYSSVAPSAAVFLPSVIHGFKGCKFLYVSW